MKTEQEIRKQAIEECIGVVSDFGTTRQGVIDKLLSLLPPSPTVSDEELEIYASGRLKSVGDITLENVQKMATELLSLRSAKAECIHTALDMTWKCLNCGKQFEQGHGKPEKAEPEINRENVIKLAEELGFVKISYPTNCWQRGSLQVFISNVFGTSGSDDIKPYRDWTWSLIRSLLSPQSSLIEKIKARLELNLKDPSETEYEKGWDDGQKQILSMISEASND